MSEEALQLTGKVAIVETENFQQALMSAIEEAGNTGGQAYPVVMFRQGNRISFSGALPMKRVDSFLDLGKSAKKGGSVDELRTASNRPHIAEHSTAIANYIKENPRDYIIPGLTINVQAPINVYTAKGGSTIKAAYMVVPDTAPAFPTDGQHRSHGIIKALEQMDDETRTRFAQDGVAFMLTCESNIEKAHQDFADCSKTKQLPPAMLTVYDLRNRANGLVIKLIDVCPIFKDKIDSTAKSIGANSPALFTANQVRQMVKALLTGDPALADQQFADVAKHMLPSGELYQETLSKFEEFINYLTEHLDVWKEASAVPPGLQHAKLKQIRSRGYVCLTATGLNIIGRIGHELLTNHPSDWQHYTAQLGSLDWSKSNPLWADIVQSKKDKHGNVVLEDVEVNGEMQKRAVMQIVTNRGPLNRAVYRASQAIGLSSILDMSEQTDDAAESDEPQVTSAEFADSVASSSVGA